MQKHIIHKTTVSEKENKDYKTTKSEGKRLFLSLFYYMLPNDYLMNNVCHNITLVLRLEILHCLYESIAAFDCLGVVAACTETTN